MKMNRVRDVKAHSGILATFTLLYYPCYNNPTTSQGINEQITNLKVLKRQNGLK